MSRVTVSELATTLEQLQAQMAEMSRHIEFLEKHNAGPNGTAAVPARPTAAPPVAAEPAAASITEKELLAISAYLGVRAHIRQIRLVSTSAWAQQGRVSIQASHRLQG